MYVPKTMFHAIEHWAAQRPGEVALRERRQAGWRELSWSAYRDEVRAVAKGLLALGVQPGECVALVGDNRIDWVVCQMGIVAAGGIPAPIYTTLVDDQVAWIVEHAEARIVICDNAEQLGKIHRGLAAGRMPTVTQIVTMDQTGDNDRRITTLKEVANNGRQADEAELDARVAAAVDEDVALLIYTSGTTGTPKAVCVDHGGISAIQQAVLSEYEILTRVPFRVVSYLPLCHIAEQLFTNVASVAVGGQVTFCADLKQIREFLVDVHPTVFLGVPRVWEKFQAVLEGRFAEATGLRAVLARWARSTELAAFRQEVETGKPVRSLARTLANRLVIKRVKDALGLDQLVLAATGAAPIGQETLEFFASLGLPIHEAYGMSETTGVATANQYGRPRFGTVGKALPGVTVRIAEDGEIVLKGRSMTRGYLRQPDKTAELIDPEGWLHTGDLGSVDAEGFVRITGRKKDILITAGGKNVAPAEMESYIKAIPGVGQVVVVGDRQAYLTALITLEAEALADLVKVSGVAVGSVAEAAAHPGIRAFLEQRIEEDCNGRVARYQQIKRFAVLPVEFTPESGEMTPTMKVKRDVVHARYAAEIASLYS
jgi:long-chain acyl-CoA synthetase